VKESIYLDGYYYPNEDSDGEEIEIVFTSTDENSLMIKAQDNEYHFYGGEQLGNFFHRILELWYPHCLQGSVNE